MARIPVPPQICAPISQRAVQLANEAMQGYAWSDKSLQALSPYTGEGLVGIKTSQKYLMHQDLGIKPFIMWWVEGRVVPLGCKSGDGPHLRTGKNPGQPGWVNIPHVGRVWRDAKWRHPGLAPKSFMETAIQQAVKEALPSIRSQMLGMLTRSK